jgi:hypothetical protein
MARLGTRFEQGVAEWVKEEGLQAFIPPEYRSDWKVESVFD